MVIVSSGLIRLHLGNSLVAKGFEAVEFDVEVQSLLQMSNVFAVKRLGYNDHGPVHARIAAGSSLEIFKLLSGAVGSSIVKDGVGSMSDAELVVMLGSYLHDIGNSIHRVNHSVHGVYLAVNILNRLLPKIYGTDLTPELIGIRQEILHVIYAHDDDVQALTIEAGAAKVGDGVDMAGGRARIPYRRGGESIHALSALAIERVMIERGENRPVKIIVKTKNPAGIFQVENVMGKKIKTSGIQQYIEVEVRYRDKVRRVSFT